MTPKTSELDDLQDIKYRPPCPPIPILIPDGYELTENGVYRVKTFVKKDGSVYEVRIPICRNRIVVTKRMYNPDNGDVFYAVEFGGKELTIGGEEICQKKGILGLAGKGLLVSEVSAKELADFLIQYIALNGLPEVKIFDRFGWKADGFLIGTTLIKKDGEEQVQLSIHSKETDAVGQKGTLEGWIEATSGLMKYRTQRLKMYVATTPILLKILGIQNFNLNDYGETSIGKTLTLRCAMSMYGTPDDLMYSGNSTQVGMERFATMFCDLPISLDETQLIDKKLLIIIIYMMANGVGKLRGSKTGGLQETLRWQNVGLFTGEAPIITETSFMGLDVRLLEISGGLGQEDQVAVQTFNTGVKNHYGVFAPLIIKYAMQNENIIKEWHARNTKQINLSQGKFAFNQIAFGMAGRLANTFAAILTAGQIFEEIYVEQWGESMDAKDIVVSLFEKIVDAKSTDSYAMRGLNFIRSWAASKTSNFLDDGWRKSDSKGKPLQYNVVGDVHKDYIDILPTELRNAVEKSFSVERLMKEFREMGLLEVDKDLKSTRTQKTAKFEGHTVKVFRFKRSLLEQMGLDLTELNKEKCH